MNDSRVKNVCVVVLGDISRSPRMKYHSLCLAESGYNVDIVGYAETTLESTITSHKNIHVHPMVNYPKLNIPKLLDYILKTLWQAFTLLCALAFKNADFVLVQNPPAVPTLAVCWFYCVCTRAKFFIDWHNYAYTIMALKLGENHMLVKTTKWVESFFGRRADVNFCVTKAMKLDLNSNWDIIAQTLHDKPSENFKEITLEEKHHLFLHLGNQHPEFKDKNNEKKSKFTEDVIDNVIWRENRPGLLISSTSWTEDEDFSVLLNALCKYDSVIEEEKTKLPDIVCVITGRGPLKEFYRKRIKDIGMKHIKVITPWLEISDYPKLLASADLGVSLHTSSSGLDLPMKIVDMFGTCLPVCAYNFNCLDELVRHEENSFVFNDSEELAMQLVQWFKDFKCDQDEHCLRKKFREQLLGFNAVGWQRNWEVCALHNFK